MNLTKTEMMFQMSWSKGLTRRTRGCDFEEDGGRLIEVKSNIFEVSQTIEMLDALRYNRPKPLLVVVSDELMVFELVGTAPLSTDASELDSSICRERAELDTEWDKLEAGQEALRQREENFYRVESSFAKLQEQVAIAEGHLSRLSSAQMAVARHELEEAWARRPELSRVGIIRRE